MDGTASHGRFCDPEQTHRVRVQPSAQSLQEFTMATPAPTQPRVKSGRPVFFFFPVIAHDRRIDEAKRRAGRLGFQNKSMVLIFFFFLSLNNKQPGGTEAPD